ncbi:MAG: c-type cytochrome biogenesis protein CcmI [Alphaproteobacteria bacterium]|nr:c-type cytochrome biogenesis protein CcmI [Alphaproteobacteria bacterium]
MIGFWALAALLIVVALATLLRPLLRAAGRVLDQGEPVAAVFRRQLSELDSEVAQGRLTADEAAAARTEITRRMLAAADRQGEQPGAAAANRREIPWRVGTVVALTGLLPAAAVAVYSAVGNPAAINPSATASAAAHGPGGHDTAELAAAADQLKARLEQGSGHPEGWALLGRTLATLGRFTEAQDAFARAIALKPDDPELHAELGEMLVLVAQGAVTPAAEAEFAKAGNDPRARYYGAEAALQRGDAATATSALKALLADAPPDAPWREAVEARLAEISPANPQAGAKTTAGPTAQDVAAAQAMSPEDRQAMIRSMVERLAARLAQNPDDREGWARLARAYDVLGEPEKAKEARARAEAAPPATAPAANTGKAQPN